MQNEHRFIVNLNWHQKSEAEIGLNRKSIKNHYIKIEGKPLLEVSAAPIFKGDASLLNPEDLLLSSLASCHMMSYLYCCNRSKIEILNYMDHAEAILKVNQDGSGKIIKVILSPTVYILDENKVKEALELHSKANQLCFIANSCNFKIEHHPLVVLIPKKLA